METKRLKWDHLGQEAEPTGFYTFHRVLLHEANNEGFRRARLTPQSEVSTAQQLQHEADKAIPHTADWSVYKIRWE